ncbi:MAG: VWA domain-containing protein [Roseiflexaceae bacterium]
MSFALPLGLLALLILPIIVVIHLIGARRRRQVIPSLLLWQGIPVRPEGARWRILPLSLLLLLHLIAAALIAVALGQPQWAGLTDGARHTAILLDTSTSMATREGPTTRLDQARERARSIINALRPGDRVTLVGVGPQPSVLAEGDAADAALLSRTLDQIQASGVGSDFDAALRLTEALLEPGPTRQIVAITDGAIPAMDPRRTTLPLEWLMVGSSSDNRAIVTFAARPWQGKLQVYARIANHSPNPFPTTLRLFADDTQVAADIVPLGPNGEYELTWSLPAGISQLRAVLDGADGLPADDLAFLSVATARPVEVLVVSAQPDPIMRALRVVAGVNATSVDPSAYQPTQSGSVALTILDDYLPQAWPEGAVLAINPPAESPLLSIATEPLPVTSDSLVRRGALMEGLSFSGVLFGSVRVIERPAWATTQLAARDEELETTGSISQREIPLVMRGVFEGHEVAIWSFNLSQSNLPARLAFPLLMSRTVRDLTAGTPPTGIPAGAAVPIRPDPQADLLVVTAPDGSEDRLAPTRQLTGLTQPGFYQVAEYRGDELLFRTSVGVNAGGLSESQIAPQAPPPIIGADRDPGAAGPLARPVDLWPWLLGLALLVLAGEWAYSAWRRA